MKNKEMLRSGSYEDISLMPTTENSLSKFIRRNKKAVLIGFVFLLIVIGLSVGLSIYFTRQEAAPEEIKHKCSGIAKSIIDYALHNSDTKVYSRLGYLCNTFGSRLSGSDNLESSLKWMVDEMALDNLSLPHHEPVYVPTWIRGNEYVKMVSPVTKSIGMLGLGGSANTNGSEITAKVIVVNSYADLQNKSHLVPGNIVLFNVPFTTYGATVQYRSSGAVQASKYGAVAALVRSVTPVSLYTPHTGATNYDTSIAPPIPFAAITVEDADYMQYLYNTDPNNNITVTIYMESHFLSDSLSSNIMAEITGSEFPYQVVSIGGHTDSWDVGQGAMDDGGGVLVAWEAVRILHALGLKPKRTVRVVGWTNEENGLRGGNAYAKDHANETHIFAIESDGGATRPNGISVHNDVTDEAFAMLKAVANLLKSIGADSLTKGGGGADVNPLIQFKAPVAGLDTDGTKYFWYHHTNADTFDKMNEDELRRCAATLAVHAYCIADAEDDLPRLK